MLESLRIKNFKSFAGEEVVSLSKTNYSILPGNCTENGILKGAMFVGANASGKSNILLAIRLLLDMLFMEKDVNSDLYKCIFNTDPRYSLDYCFRIADRKLEYEFIVDTEKRIISETLDLDGQILLDRLGDTARVFISDPRGTIFDSKDVDERTLFLRTLYFNTRFSGNEVLKEWMQFLGRSVYINAFEKKIVSYGKQDLDVVHYLKKNGSDEINGFFKEYRFMQTIQYRGNNNSDEEKDILFTREDVDEAISFEYESTGNQNLLRMLPAFLTIASSGGMLLIDEFSSGFHNELETLLIKYFMEKSKRAQLIFVSHSTNLLSNSILRPDQEYVVEFHGRDGSVLKRISSEQPRAAQNIEKMYMSGVFGGLPEYKGAYDQA